MAKVNLVEKQVQMANRDIIRYQLMTECFIRQIQLSSSELNCLALLGALGNTELAPFCNATVEEGIFKTSQTVRNFLTKVEKKSKLITKTGGSRKKIMLNPEFNVQAKGNILLNYKIVHIATEEQ